MLMSIQRKGHHPQGLLEEQTKTVTAKEPTFRYEAFDRADARRLKNVVEKVHNQKAVITRQLSGEHTFTLPMRMTGRSDIDPVVNDKALRKNMRTALPGTELTYAARIKSLKLTQSQAQALADALKEGQERQEPPAE